MKPARRFLAALFALLAVEAAASDEGRFLDAEAARAYAAVGRLNIAGRRFCSATLIAPDRVLTAAHCLYHPTTGRPAPMEELRFVAGQHVEGHAAVRGVRRAAAHPDFRAGGTPTPTALATDVALLELDAPVSAEEAAPIGLGAFPAGGAVTLVSYSRERPQAPSMQDCRAVAEMGGLAALTCSIAEGASGAPLFARTGGREKLVAVVSASGELGASFTLAVIALPKLRMLESRLVDGP